jgi:GNAT superfamily N-acetyltransferase
MSDARAVFEVMAAEEEHDTGSVEIEEADIVGDWQRPSFDVGASTIGVFDGERLVAYGEHGGDQRADAAVHPAYRGRGLGTAIAAWVRDTARGRGETEVGMPVPQGSDGDRLLAALGYHVRWESWLLELPAGREIEPQPLPEGYTLRSAGTEEERRAAHEVVEDAFLEWSRRARSSYEDFAARTVLRPGFQPWMLRAAVDPEGATVGVCTSSMNGDLVYVAQLAVRRDRRGLGLARALLVDAFTLGRQHGASRFELSTDSRTGALGLYERVGMEVTHTWVNRAVALT